MLPYLQTPGISNQALVFMRYENVLVTDILAKSTIFDHTPVEKWFGPRIFVPWNFLKNLISTIWDSFHRISTFDVAAFFHLSCLYEIFMAYSKQIKCGIACIYMDIINFRRVFPDSKNHPLYPWFTREKLLKGSNFFLPNSISSACDNFKRKGVRSLYCIIHPRHHLTSQLCWIPTSRCHMVSEWHKAL